ncbi:hypothetical protein JX265_005324 [Neoarthrinium moseri]|uniref:DUF3824 domain-containing protein n=1 Tax=Neoarthrinium moseri TaxID=1658444 RepID=A0A9P9WNF7_9PEZI|nr:uncharacterized protein JN550_006219 [Neoarthrinium moseri]KAI1845634.1 hypothetical protein JX266_008245 [Neoarthrinium moseri]KAI1868644.1 hypothetical protein JN550_006219 [Neoarthrinium moseri]KAI1872444.1 hypothetical protein JX265_005324 [Neoarthrinium moseri]
MSGYDTYDAPPRERRYYREERRERREEPRYEEYLSVNPSSRNQLIPRAREDSDLSIEEIRRDFPPPGYGGRDARRARSAEPGYYEDDYYRRDYDNRSMRDEPRDHRSRKAGSVYYEEEERTRKRVLNKQEKIVAAVLGGVLAAGAKEVWDRREAGQEGSEVHRNLAASAALAAGGALAGYQGADFYNKRAVKEEKKSTYVVHKGRDGRVSEYYSDEDEDPRSKKSNKSFLENALSAAGLGGAVKALTGGGDKHDDHRSDARSRRGSPDSTKSRGGDNATNRMQKAAKASLVAGAAEAFRVAREPGGWKGEKMKRILTVAAGAATIDAAHDPTKDSKRHLMESVIGGLVGNRVLNGSRKDIEEDRRTGRSRSRSRAPSQGGGGGASGLAALATAGLGALGTKKLLEKKDDSRSRSRRGSPDSYYDRDESPRRRHRSRSRSVVDTARRSLAKIGLGSGPDEKDDYDDSRSARGGRRRGHSPDDRYDDDYTSRGYMRGGRGDDHYDDDRSARGGRRRSTSRQRGGRSGSVSSSDLGDSDEDEKRAKKMRGKQILTTGLATVATIHAAHNVYSSMEKRNARHRAVKEGRLDPMEAKKLKSKAILQDAASVGIAAMGIKGAISELKEAREQNHQVKEWREEKSRRHERRMERLQRANDDHYGRSRADNWSSSAPPRERRYYDDGPRYADGNPYSATLPAPPVGYDRR